MSVCPFVHVSSSRFDTFSLLLTTLQRNAAQLFDVKLAWFDLLGLFH